jgi:hypothetical protein
MISNACLTSWYTVLATKKVLEKKCLFKLADLIYAQFPYIEKKKLSYS